MASIEETSTTRSLAPPNSLSTNPSASLTTSSLGNSGGWWLSSKSLTWKFEETTYQFVPAPGWPFWVLLISFTNAPPGTIALSPGTTSPSAAYETRYFTNAPIPFTTPPTTAATGAAPGSIASPLAPTAARLV